MPICCIDGMPFPTGRPSGPEPGAWGCGTIAPTTQRPSGNDICIIGGGEGAWPQPRGGGQGDGGGTGVCRPGCIGDALCGLPINCAICSGVAKPPCSDCRGSTGTEAAGAAGVPAPLIPGLRLPIVGPTGSDCFSGGDWRMPAPAGGASSALCISSIRTARFTSIRRPSRSGRKREFLSPRRRSTAPASDKIANPNPRCFAIASFERAPSVTDRCA